jgi:hypothetical protein
VITDVTEADIIANPSLTETEPEKLPGSGEDEKADTE